MQGSGWGWLGYSPELKRLVITTTANQDPLSTQASHLLLQLQSVDTATTIIIWQLMACMLMA